MNIFNMVRERINEHKAQQHGIDAVKYKDYMAKRKKEAFLAQQTAEREQNLRFIREKAKIETNQKISALKEKKKRSISMGRNIMEGRGPNVAGNATSKIDFGTRGFNL